MTAARAPANPLAGLAGAVLVVASLYFARPVLIPIALAILLAFLLGPIVDWLQRRGLREAPAVGMVVIAGLALVAGLLVALWLQLGALVEQLPRYRENVIEKVHALRSAQEGTFSDEAQEALAEIAGELESPEEEAEAAASVPVRIQEEKRSPLLAGLPALAGLLASAGLVVVLVLFLLLGRRSLRDRIIFLFGRRHLTVITKALDEASHRISRYLLMQGLVNGGFGIAVGVALALLGVDYALLWGVFAAVLRFVPYVGPWVAAAMPLALSLAVFPGWGRPLAVIGVYALLELTFNMLLEPLLYGKTAGVSQVALLVAIAFWTWLWGAIGLVLATPMTVCLVVLGKYVPALHLIAELMGETPIAEPEVRFYQRILARDEDEAVEAAHELVATAGADAVADRLLLYALGAAKRDLRQGALDADDAVTVLQGLRAVLDELESAEPAREAAAAGADRGCPLVLAYPASDESDRIGLRILQWLLRRAGACEVEVLGTQVLVSELVERIERDRPRAVVVGSLAPGGLSQALNVAKRLRGHFPALRMIVARWAAASGQVERLLGVGADRVATSLVDTRRDVVSFTKLAPVDPHAVGVPEGGAVAAAE